MTAFTLTTTTGFVYEIFRAEQDMLAARTSEDYERAEDSWRFYTCERLMRRHY